LLPKCGQNFCNGKGPGEIDRSLRPRVSGSKKTDPFLLRAVREALPAFSTQLPYSSLQHNGRFLLPRHELLRPLAPDEDATKGLGFGIRDHRQPVMMPAPAICAVVRDLAFRHGRSPMAGPIAVRPPHSGHGFLRSSGVGLSKAHGDARDSSDDIRLLRIRTAANLAPRVGIRNREQMTFTDFAPPANILISQCNKMGGHSQARPGCGRL
jgi:hypothetical protein